MPGSKYNVGKKQNGSALNTSKTESTLGDIDDNNKNIFMTTEFKT